MMFFKFFMALFFALASFLVVGALPIYLVAKDVWAPAILSPNKTSEWTVGSSQEVIWDLSDRPAQITNPNGTIYLIVNNLIDFSHELTSGFLLTEGAVEITVPQVPAGEYAIVLFGDSGNWSSNFTITNPSGY